MKDHNQEHLIDIHEGIAVSVTTKKDWSSILFEAGSAMKEIMSRTRGVYDDDGKVIAEGEFRRRWLHSKLDQWIDENLKEKK